MVWIVCISQYCILYVCFFYYCILSMFIFWSNSQTWPIKKKQKKTKQKTLFLTDFHWHITPFVLVNPPLFSRIWPFCASEVLHRHWTTDGLGLPTRSPCTYRRPCVLWIKFVNVKTFLFLFFHLSSQLKCWDTSVFLYPNDNHQENFISQGLKWVASHQLYCVLCVQ